MNSSREKKNRKRKETVNQTQMVKHSNTIKSLELKKQKCRIIKFSHKNRQWYLVSIF
jgi:hypothetical protein